MHPNICISLCASVCYMLTHTSSISSVHVRIGRGYACVHRCAMAMDRRCAHGLAGSCCGLGLIPKPETVRALARRRRPHAASARRRSTRRRLSTRTSARGTPRRSSCCLRCAPPGPAARNQLCRTRMAGLRCGAAGCAQRHRRCARVRTCAGTRLRGALGVGTACRRGGSIIHASEYIHTYTRVCYTRILPLSIHLYV